MDETWVFLLFIFIYIFIFVFFSQTVYKGLTKGLSNMVKNTGAHRKLSTETYILVRTLCVTKKDGSS